MQTTYLAKDLYVEYIKNIQDITVKTIMTTIKTKSHKKAQLDKWAKYMNKKHFTERRCRGHISTWKICNIISC